MKKWILIPLILILLFLGLGTVISNKQAIMDSLYKQSPQYTKADRTDEILSNWDMISKNFESQLSQLYTEQEKETIWVTLPKPNKSDLKRVDNNTYKYLGNVTLIYATKTPINSKHQIILTYNDDGTLELLLGDPEVNQ